MGQELALAVVLLRQRRTKVVALALAAVCACVAFAFLIYEQGELEERQLKHLDLLSKVLEGHTSRELNGASNLLRSIPDLLEGRDTTLGTQATNELLSEAIRNQPLLRSITVLDASGVVLSSSDATSTGQAIAVEELGFQSLRPGVVSVGSLVHGRDLIQVRASAGSSTSITALPMGLIVQIDGRDLLLVALLNLDYFTNQHELIVNNDAVHTVITTMDGRLITTDSHVDASPGEFVSALPYPGGDPAHGESGRHIGRGLNNQRVLGSFRASRQWPVVQFVELDYQVPRAEFNELARNVGALILAAWALIAAAAMFVLRAQRREAKAATALAETTRKVGDSEARKSAILASALDCLITVDKFGRIIDFNPAAERTFGHRAQDVINQDLIALLIPEHMRSEFYQGLRTHVETGSHPVVGRRIEVVAMRADGKRFDAELSIADFKAGGETMFALSARDISERKAAEEERNALLARYRSVATDLERQRLALDQHAIVSISDARGVITHANSKLCLVSGHAVEELVGRVNTLMRPPQPIARACGTGDGQAVWSPECSESTRHDILSHIERGLIWEGELLHQRKNGTPFWAASTIVPMHNLSGELEQVFLIQTDITQRIQAQRAVAEARELELQIGSRIQQTLLVTPADQRLPKTWLSTYTRASQGIDGDFVEVLSVGDDCVDVIAGDVMGKGVGAALIGAATKMQLGHCLAELTTSTSLVGTLPQPAQMIRALHRAMFPSLQALDAFVTLTYVRIDTKAETVSWVGCGHEEPILVSPDGQCTVLHNQYPPLGVLADDHYVQESVPMGMGDGLFMCSDGITDALRADGSRIGRSVVKAHVESMLKVLHTPATILHTLRRKLLSGDVRITDDMTMIMALRTDATVNASRRELSFALHELAHVRGLVEARSRSTSMSEDEVSLFTVACVEAFTNIVRHATGHLPDEPIELVVRREPDRLTVEFVYLADPFEAPQEFQPTDFGLYPEGGFGLSIMQEASDRLEHEHRDGVNTIRLTKRCRCPS